MRFQIMVKIISKNIEFNPFVPTVPTFAVRETQSLGQQMLNAPVGINGTDL